MRNSNEPWEFIYFSNKDYAGDLVSRRSITGFIIYVLGVLVSWQLKLQKSVSLSSSDEEYVALSQVMLVIQLLESMTISIKYPVMVRVNNVGDTFMARNLLPPLVPSTWISGKGMLMSMLTMELLRKFLLSPLIMTATFSPKI